MDLTKTYKSIVNDTKELRSEAARLTLLADTLESAKRLLGMSPMAMEATARTANPRKVGNTGNRLTPTKREQLDAWLAKGEKSIRDMATSLGVTRAACYQRRDLLDLNTYHRGAAGK